MKKIEFDFGCWAEAAQHNVGFAAYEFGSTGYVKFNNGFILQWGAIYNRSTITFPISFTMPSPVVTMTHRQASAESTVGHYGGLYANTTSLTMNYTDSDDTTAGANWIAIGY